MYKYSYFLNDVLAHVLAYLFTNYRDSLNEIIALLTTLWFLVVLFTVFQLHIFDCNNGNI